MRPGSIHSASRGVMTRLLLATALAAFGASAVTPQAPTAPAGEATVRYCPVCGAPNRAENKFCLKDGTPLPPIEPGRRSPGFVRSPGTYSAEEIQQVMRYVSESVVRIRVRTKTTYKYPVTYWKDEEAKYFHRAMLGKLVSLHKKTQAAGGQLTLCNLDPDIYEAFESSRLDKFFAIEPANPDTDRPAAS